MMSSMSLNKFESSEGLSLRSAEKSSAHVHPIGQWEQLALRANHWPEVGDKGGVWDASLH